MYMRLLFYIYKIIEKLISLVKNFLSYKFSISRESFAQKFRFS